VSCREPYFVSEVSARLNCTGFDRGNIDEADAQDVRAGTVLDSLTVEEEEALGRGFLSHRNRECCCAIAFADGVDHDRKPA
jgi:hypothetical protein